MYFDLGFNSFLILLNVVWAKCYSFCQTCITDSQSLWTYQPVLLVIYLPSSTLLYPHYWWQSYNPVTVLMLNYSDKNIMVLDFFPVLAFLKCFWGDFKMLTHILCFSWHSLKTWHYNFMGSCSQILEGCGIHKLKHFRKWLKKLVVLNYKKTIILLFDNCFIGNPHFHHKRTKHNTSPLLHSISCCFLLKHRVKCYQIIVRPSTPCVATSMIYWCL